MVAKQHRKRILILGFLGLGDIVQFSPCFRILREGFPDSYIVLVTLTRSVYDIFKQSPYIDETLLLDMRSSSLDKLKLITSLRKRRFNISILPYPSYRREENIISRIIAAKDRYSFRFHKEKFTEFSFLNNRLLDADDTIHNVENNLRLMRKMGLHTEGREKYDIPLQHLCSSNEFFTERGIAETDFKIGIHPGSGSRATGKRLEVSKFAEISDHLAEKYNAKVLVFFGPEEDELKYGFVNLSKCQHTIVENMQLDSVSQIISKCHLFIVGDSGLMHIASAVGIPVVAIFGPTSHTALHPWGVPYQIVRLGLECSPCYDFTEYRSLNESLIECKIDDKFACIKKIQTNDILNKIDKMISLLYPGKSLI